MKETAVLDQLRVGQNGNERSQYDTHRAEEVPVHSVFLSEEMSQCVADRKYDQHGQYEQEWHDVPSVSRCFLADRLSKGNVSKGNARASSTIQPEMAPHNRGFRPLKREKRSV